MQRLAKSCLIVIAGWLIACSDDADEQVLQLSYEAIPGTGVALDQGPVDTSGANFADKQELTEQVFEQVVPGVMAAVGLEIDSTDSELAPGGFLLVTNPSMQTRLTFAADAADADQRTDQLAAALGYVMYQWSVLVTDFAAEDGDTGFATVQFSGGAVDDGLAQQFFEHAASVDDGLGGGYSAFGNEMIFLNVRDDAGEPFSGLDDDAFIAAMEQAASSFADASAVVSESGSVDARFVGNDWATAADGEEYLAVSGADATAALDMHQDTFNQLIEDAATRYGWTIGAPSTVHGIQRGRFSKLPVAMIGRD